MRKQTLPVLLALACGALLARCGQALLTAPAGSELRITANPRFIPAHGGVSVISVLVVEPAGTVVPDGTVVQFFTTLGSIDEQGRTNDGVVRVNLLATGLSGNADVTAVSGGPATSPSSTTAPSSTTTTLRPGPAPSLAPFVTALGTGQATVTVTIGSALPASVVVTADRTRITAQQPARIRAFVLDQDGNPVANVPVVFRLSTATATEILASGGNPRFTDNNGIAEDVLSTTAPAGSPPRTVAVVALTPNGTLGTTNVTVN